MEVPGPSYEHNETQAYALSVLAVTTAVTITAILWRNDFFGGVYRFFVLLKASMCCFFANLVCKYKCRVQFLKPSLTLSTGSII